MTCLRPLLLALAIATLSPVTAAVASALLPAATTPEEVGLSSAQLARIEAVTKKHIEAGLVPGAVMLVARRGKIAWHKSLGFRDRAAQDAMRADAMFRIYSMTKPIVSVAAMMLVEEGRFQVGDPVASILPEMAKVKVGIEKDAAGKPTMELVAAAGDDRAGSAAAHVGTDLRLARDVTGQCRLYRSKDRRSGRQQRRACNAGGGAATAVLAGRAVGIWRLYRRAWPSCRGGNGQDAG